MLIAAIYHLIYSCVIIITSWILGIGVNSLLRTAKFYRRLTSFHFIKNKSVNRIIGLYAVKWMVRNTLLKHLNPKLFNATTMERNELKTQMIYAEVSHLAGFFFANLMVVVLMIYSRYQFGLILFFMNVILNLYPALLQQLNKARVTKIVARSAGTNHPTRYLRVS